MNGYQPEVILEDAREELRHLAVAVEESAESEENARIASEEAGQLLGALYNEAQEAGDDHTMQRILRAWDRAQLPLQVAMKNREIAVGLLGVAQSLDARADKAETEVAEINRALVGDGHHPAVSRYNEQIEGELLEMMVEGTTDSMLDNMMDWGFDPRATNTLMQLVSADGDWSNADIDHLIGQLEALKARFPEDSNGR